MMPPLRLWPALAAAALLLVAKYGSALLVPDQAGGISVLGGLVFAAIVLIWWLAFSRASWTERLAAVALVALAIAATRPFLHPSITNGMMGMMQFVLGTPIVLLGLVVWASTFGARRTLPPTARFASMAVTLLLAASGWLLFRTDGIDGSGAAQLAWRWTPTAEQRLLLARNATPEIVPVPAPVPPPSEPTANPPAPASLTQSHEPPPSLGDWSGFRGPHRDSVVTAPRLQTNWTDTSPTLLWRRQVGPGWSSFAVHANLLYTQEQLGEHEVVSCYEAATGKPLWTHRDTARFWESNGGAGPRATPAVHNGRVYTLGATGILNALDARTGSVIWSRNAASDTGAKLPGWGFAGSPLIHGDMVVAAASGRLAAYSLDTGNPRWSTTSGAGYASPHLATTAGITQILLINSAGLLSVSPDNGVQLWQHAWEGTPMLQPVLLPGGDILVTTGSISGGAGTRRLSVNRPTPDSWSVEERWTSSGLKPYFNDLVVNNGYAYGFDGGILSCIDLKDGQRKWKGGRYGHGQMLLLAAQDTLLVLSEEGEIALVSATPDAFREITRFRVLEGKTWNHPVLIGDVLFVRNGEEMAAFRLPQSGS
ncbi:MAG: PQQ-like beta-propeller repeat protein [Acidobacteria bacterium]|nr:PQQ-like beta-propeller repeat protein [Acidobacteriota bacterium]